MIHLWLAKDPQTERITAQTREWGDGDFPLGPRGRRWERREVDVEEQVWNDLLAGEIAPDKQDALHEQWWGA